jgi:hypothetical protein
MPLAMTRTRAAARIAGGGLLVAWLVAAGVPSPSVRVAPAPVLTASADGFSPIKIQTQKLRSRIESPSVLRPSSRNPFKFAARRAVTSVHPPALSTAAPAPAAVPPSLTLAGIAELETSAGTVRTAVISGLAQLFLVKEGEPVTSRYRVSRIGADAVELHDGVTGATIRLGLR